MNDATSQAVNEKHPVPVEADGQRLDQWVAARYGLSRTRAQGLIADGNVLLDERPGRKSERVAAGQILSIIIPPPEPVRMEPEDIPLAIAYEDSHIVVVNKPAGLVVHPGPGHPRGTLVNALLHHVGDLAGVGGRLRPGIVHRLDKDTSGLLVVAKDDASHLALTEALRRRDVRREYLALAWGHLSESPLVIDAPIGRNPRDRLSMAVVEGGRAARTNILVKERLTGADFLRVRLHSGRTHQIRVHLLHLGHPVVGDRLYGTGWERGMSGTGREWGRRLADLVTRPFLHAHRLGFDHPVSGKEMRFEAPLPGDLQAALAWARRGPERSTHGGSEWHESQDEQT